MAGFLRQNILTSYILTLLSWLLVLLVHDISVRASPVVSDLGLLLGHDTHPATQFWKRVTPVVVSSQAGDNTTVINPSTDQVIAQGPGTDGGGSGPAAIIWLVFVFVVGIPLALTGVRLWRFTTGMAVGLALTVCGTSPSIPIPIPIPIPAHVRDHLVAPVY